MSLAMSASFAVTPATLADAAAFAEIYGHHVVNGTATFETVPPDAAAMEARMRGVLDAGWPWLAAREADGTALGFAYAMQLRDRPAYRYACEDTIYLRHDRLGQGIGTALLSALIDAAEAWGFRQMVALIAGTEPASIALHAQAGFHPCGTLAKVGRKHGQWIDVHPMQRALGQGDSTPPMREP